LLKENAEKEPPLPMKNPLARIVSVKGHTIPARSGSADLLQSPAIDSPTPLRPNKSLPNPTNLEDDQEVVPRSGLMNAIKSRQFKLRKTEPTNVRKGDIFNNEVAAILSRRAALEMSSDEDCSDEEWI
jgi:hypothetical protein